MLSTISTAAALLLTTVASSAPVNSHSSPRMMSSRSPRRRRRKIELQRDRVAHRGDGGLDCGFGNEGAAEIGVQHRAGEIIDRPEPRTLIVLQMRKRDCRGAFRIDLAIAAVACGSKRCANCADKRLVSKAIKGNRCGPGPQHCVDRGQVAQIGWRPRLCRHWILHYTPKERRDVSALLAVGNCAQGFAISIDLAAGP